MSAAGSLTVETALVLPMFMFAMISVIFLAEAIRFSANMTAALSETATEYAKFAYAYEKCAGGMPQLAEKLGGKVFAATAAKAQVMHMLGSDYIASSPVESGESGISFIHSSVMGEDEMIDLVAVYRIDTPYDLLNISNPVTADRARVRAFTGYDNSKNSKKDKKAEETVFITRTGSVYHRSIGCKHLNFTIRTADMETLNKERNNGGAKYYPCEHCARKAAHGLVYITDDGTRYHTSLDCSDLTRDIKEVPISQAGGRGPCKDCSQ